MATKIEEVSASATINWKIDHFSKLDAQNGTSSPVFSVGNYKWEAIIYPKGKGDVYDHLSLFLKPVGLTKSVETEMIFAVTSLIDPINTVRNEGKYKFRASDPTGIAYGWTKFMPLSELHNPAEGFIVNDTCSIAVEVTCWLKEEGSYAGGGGAVKDRDSNKVTDSKRQKIKAERQ